MHTGDEIHQFYCYLRTKRDRFKKHYMFIQNSTIEFCKRPTDSECAISHSLSECHLRLAKAQQTEDGKGKVRVFYPV